jgi:integrase/recombinase XerD
LIFELEPLIQFRATWKHKNLAARNRTENTKALFRFCHDSGWIKENVAMKLKAPKVIAPPTQPFTRDEFQRIVKACESYKGNSGPMLKAFVLLLRYSGLRIRDAACLRREAVINGKLLLYMAKTGTPVYVPLPPEGLDALQALPKNGDYYFLDGAGQAKDPSQ